ncbi:MAG: Zn-dependent hydrolase [Bacteroidales bacterium]|nr:Zn-dependent hydrolase [Bacteroidales bacterium]
MKKIAIPLLALAIAATTVANAQNNAMTIKDKIEQYATVPLKADMEKLSERERELVSLFIEIADVMDDIYWEQTFGEGNRKRLKELEDPDKRRFAEIQYGAWDRLDGDRPFLSGYGDKPAGANFYPADMKEAEFNKLDDPLKTSPYSILRRDIKGNIIVIPYSKAYAKQLRQADMLLGKAIELAEDEEMKNYLEARREALRSDEYQKSDMVWMDMKKSRLDFVFGPIENYEDGLFGLKTSFEAFVLIKDEDWSGRLERYTSMLPEMQTLLPCDPKYKRERPGTESDLYVYDVVYYAGECNAAGKTIAINLPNDEQVQLERGTRRMQLRNAMEAKYENILFPIANLMIDKSQIKNVRFEAFFNNVCFHEVAHGLGIKNTIDGKGTVREALKNQYSAWEEAKADICGLFMVQTLIEKGELKGISVEDAYVSYMAGLLRSVRFGAKEAHGIANIMCFNFMQDRKAFTRTKDGRYKVDVKNMRKAIEEWAALVLATEGNGDYKAASNYAAKNGTVRLELQHDLKTIEKAKIPIDIVFKQGPRELGLKKAMHKHGGKSDMGNDMETIERPNPKAMPSKR